LVGIESTIINCTQRSLSILRSGAVTKELIEENLDIKIKEIITAARCNQIKVSGMLESHYSPIAKVYLYNSATKGDGFIALSKFPTPTGAIRLANPIDNSEFARILYAAFRLADLKGLRRIFVIPPVGGGIAVAINDRLRKSAT
jgi:L-threonylcarbamoyladenylate synthase